MSCSLSIRITLYNSIKSMPPLLYQLTLLSTIGRTNISSQALVTSNLLASFWLKRDSTTWDFLTRLLSLRHGFESSNGSQWKVTCSRSLEQVFEKLHEVLALLIATSYRLVRLRHTSSVISPPSPDREILQLQGSALFVLKICPRFDGYRIKFNNAIVR